MNKENNNSKKVTTKIPPALFEKLISYTQEKDINKSQIIRLLLTEFLKNNNK